MYDYVWLCWVIHNHVHDLDYVWPSWIVVKASIIMHSYARRYKIRSWKPQVHDRKRLFCDITHHFDIDFLIRDKSANWSLEPMISWFITHFQSNSTLKTINFSWILLSHIWISENFQRKIFAIWFCTIFVVFVCHFLMNFIFWILKEK